MICDEIRDRYQMRRKLAREVFRETEGEFCIRGYGRIEGLRGLRGVNLEDKISKIRKKAQEKKLLIKQGSIELPQSSIGGSGNTLGTSPKVESFNMMKDFVSKNTFGEDQNIDMIECDTPLLKKKVSKADHENVSTTEFMMLSSSEDESFEDIEDNMDILDSDHDPTRWISEETKKYSAFGRVLEWLLPAEGLELLLVNKTCYGVAKLDYLNNVLQNY